MRRLLLAALLIAACAPAESSADQAANLESTTTSSTTTSSTAPESTTTTIPDFTISSPAFDDGGTIPAEHTCDGADVSPELKLVGIPEETRSLVIVVDDPDAPLGTWDHWVEFDVVTGPGSHDIPRNAGQVGVRALNSWNLPGYMGPCPPEGEEHEYRFTVHALSTVLDLSPGVESEPVYTQMGDSVIESVQMTGLYGR